MWSYPDAGDSRAHSPILLPRTTAAQGDGLCTITRGATLDKCRESGVAFPIDANGSSIAISHSQIKPNLAGPSHVFPIESASSQHKSAGCGQSPDDGSERLLRLSHRRNRRRARRYAPKAAEDTGDSEPSETGASQPAKRRQKIQSTEKQKKNKVAPALLLMQNFSAQNLGKSRLTIRPSLTIGVFNKGKASGKIITKRSMEKPTADIVFSESRFLEKAGSIPANGGSPDKDSKSESSDDHSVHSLMERGACQESQMSLPDSLLPEEPTASRRNGCKSPNSSFSVREGSLPWDIEEPVPPSARSTEPPVHPSSFLTQQKDITIGVKQCAWASRLRKQDAHTSAKQGIDGMSFVSQPGNPHPHVQDNRTTSNYFPEIDTNMASQAPTALLSRSENFKPPIHGIVCYHTTPLDLDDPPRTPECLQLEHAGSIRSTGGARKRALETYVPWNDSAELISYPRTNQRSIDDWHPEKEYARDMWDPEVSGNVWQGSPPDERREVDNYGHDWSGSLNDFLTDAEEAGEAHPNLDYGDLSSRIVDTQALHGSEGEPYPSYERGHASSEDFEAELYVGVPGYYLSSGLKAIEGDELPSYRTTDVDITVVGQSSFVPSEFEFELNEQGFSNEARGDEDADRPPRLVHIITQASLQNDLFKSMGNHWNSAHRLY